MSEALTDGLSSAEQAFFDSQGATEIPADVGSANAADTQQNDAQDAAEGGADAGSSEQLRDEKGKFVPHGAFHEERTKRQQLERQLADMQAKQAVLDDRWNTLLKAGNSKQEEPPAPPSPEEDIFGYMKWQADQIKSMQTAQQEREKAENDQRQAVEQENAIWSHWNHSRTEYVQTNKDFDNAANWLSDYRMGQLKAMALVDPSMATEQARNRQINAELKSIIISAHQQGQNPADLIYRLAQGYGYKPGTVAASAQPDQQNADLSAKVDQLGKALDASKTLTASNGKNAADPMSAEAIANMSESEFTAWMKDPANERRFRQMMGG
ncbi:hypothetical protein PH562_16700 [Rhizobium sp. CNPSo 4062]|uniref:hypothetical protein n=1 Tax=Rhizobium sp. CNPSo 4062 TaxID=3021410 RepID=UPI00254BA23C|nr:hypothetical protein [Rhizobium sp. CNPSo 4062]MDK4703892.1 hypothetical protein [Rhizobium sp. CNPSo 4062]